MSILWGALGITALCLGGFLMLVSGSFLSDPRRLWLRPFVLAAFWLADMGALAHSVWKHEWLQAAVEVVILVAVVRTAIRNRRQARFLDQPRTGASA